MAATLPPSGGDFVSGYKQQNARRAAASSRSSHFCPEHFNGLTRRAHVRLKKWRKLTLRKEVKIVLNCEAVAE